MKKRLLGILFCLLMLSFVLAGCGKDTQTSGKGGKKSRCSYAYEGPSALESGWG
jgi:predicted small secreted protein